MSRGDPLRVRDYLEHVAEAIANIREYTAGMDAAAYLADRKTQDAVVRNFEVIGEGLQQRRQAPCRVRDRPRRDPMEFRL